MKSHSPRVLVVNQNHPKAHDSNKGTPQSPLRTINAAAQVAAPGDTVMVHAGVYRERVSPSRGGVAGKPIVYTAAPGETVCLRGSEVFRPSWRPLNGAPGVFVGSLSSVKFGVAAYHGYCDPRINANFNPYLVNYNRNVIARPHRDVVASMRTQLVAQKKKLKETDPTADPSGYNHHKDRIADAEKMLQLFTRKRNPWMRTSLGQVFLDGYPLTEVEHAGELTAVPGTWMVSSEGDALLVHPNASDVALTKRLVEISVRHTVFSPLTRGLGYIHVNGFIIEHAANPSNTWGNTGWPQSGLLSTRTGHHWVIENNTIRYAKYTGIDCGSEHIDSDKIEFEGDLVNAGRRMWQDYMDHKKIPENAPGNHLIRNNRVCDNGQSGITGLGHYRTRVIGNIIERNNRTGYTSPWWEFGGIKFHAVVEAVIEGNLIRDNDAHGIWLDNQWQNTRVTRNVIINNLWSGINMELGRGPCCIDNNIIAYTRQGDGIYGHDMSDFTIAHNLIYGNANFGVWVAWATPRVKAEDGCWDIKTHNNMILGNKTGAIGYPMPWEFAGNNTSNGNLFMGGGEYLDEGSRPRPPIFQLTNHTHCAPMRHACSAKVLMTKENTIALFVRLLNKARVPEVKRPNMELWSEQYFVNIDLWHAVLGQDKSSRVMRVIRDGLQSRLVSWECEIDPVIREVKCNPVKGVDKDFLGNKMPAKNPLPGPFQDLEVGVRNHITLWPVRGTGSSLLLE